MDKTKLMYIIAYYLSEYDMDAVNKLGFNSRSEAFKQIGQIFGKNNNYLKRLRDEYDVVTSSSRNGQCNRPPRERIIKTASHMKQFSFDEITDIVSSIISNTTEVLPEETENNAFPIYDISDMSELELENIINFKDENAGIIIKSSQTQQRVYNTEIIKQLKNLYKGNCQICAHKPFSEYIENICEVHHIKYFAISHNNDSSNLMYISARCKQSHLLFPECCSFVVPIRVGFGI